jgi:ABC-2 type transport system permease protein
MTSTRSTTLVAGREIRETFRRRSFWAIAAILFVGAAAAMIVPELLRDDADPRYDVVVVGRDEVLDASLEEVASALDLDVRLSHVEQVSTARDRVEDERVDVAVVPGEEPRIIAISGENERMVAAARQALTSAALVQRLDAEGLSSAQIQAATDVPAPRLEEIDEEKAGRTAAAAVISIVLYILLLSLMIQVANGVAVEKSNRISEVLLAIVRPGALLFGKVLGVGVVGIVTLAAGALPVVVKIVVGGDLPDGIGAAVAGSALWFLFGLVLYLIIAGSLGALVERQEQSGSVVAPLTFLLIGTYIVAQSSADSTLGLVLAYFPLTSPLMVPTRIAMGVATPVELVISALLLIAAIVLAGRVGSTIYARGIVRTGRRLTVRDALRNS